MVRIARLSLPALLLAASLNAAEDEAVSRHQISVAGKPLHYTVRADFMPLYSSARELKARIFYVAYTLDRAAESKPRPVTFAWNGGPGSPAALLHLGALGPRRVKLPDEYATPPPPYQLADNESTWLDMTDLVLVDPVGTGYSFAVKPEFNKEFWSVQGDIDSIGEFIRIYLTRFDARDAPVFIVGESYGTLRAAGLAETMVNRGIPLNGVILISSILNFQLTASRPGNDLPYALLLPSFTATAFAHKKLPAEMQSNFEETVKKAEAWAETEYMQALMKGDRLTEQERKSVAARMARYIGIDADVLEKNNLRISRDQFAKLLLADQKKSVAHYDTRMSGPLVASEGPYDPRKDPSLTSDGTSTAIVSYLRSELGFKTDAMYAGPFGGGYPSPTSFRGDWMSMRWDYQLGPGGGYIDRTDSLRRAMQENSAIRVFIASGYFDLATPHFATDYTLSHMGLDPKLRRNIVVTRYRGGHAVYLDKEIRPRFKQDIAAFIRDTIQAK